MNVSEQLTPERWLLAIGQQPVRDSIDAELKALAAPGDQPTFARWRLQHGLVQFIGPDELGLALRRALDEGCPAVHLHSTMPETDLQDALSTARLRGGEERRLEAGYIETLDEVRDDHQADGADEPVDEESLHSPHKLA